MNSNNALGIRTDVVVFFDNSSLLKLFAVGAGIVLLAAMFFSKKG